MVGYGTEPLTTADAGEPSTAVDAESANADAQAPPAITLAEVDGGGTKLDADAPVVPSASDAAAVVGPDMPAPVPPTARDGGALALPPAEEEPRGETCRGPRACDLTCSRSSDSSCSARCVDAPVCALTCAGPSTGPGGGACQLGCDRVTTCTPACAPGARCAIRCRDTNECFVGCEGGSGCDVACEASTCAVNCAPGAACLLRCAPGTACGFWDCRAGERVCANGVRACGTRCPEER